MSILKYLFPVPKPDSKRVITFANHDDYICFRQHTYRKVRESEAGQTLKNLKKRLTDMLSKEENFASKLIDIRFCRGVFLHSVTGMPTPLRAGPFFKTNISHVHIHIL